MVATLIDRLVHHCPIVNTRGNRYRVRKHCEVASRLAGPPPRGTPDRHCRPARQET
jgi:hypothetical protein